MIPIIIPYHLQTNLCTQYGYIQALVSSILISYLIDLFGFKIMKMIKRTNIEPPNNRDFFVYDFYSRYLSTPWSKWFCFWSRTIKTEHSCW